MDNPYSLTGADRNSISEQVVPRSLKTCADLIVHYLEQIGVRYLFGIPGGAIQPLYNALARSRERGGLKSVVARHESGCSFMADGFTRESGVMGVCCATTGPGSTNLITGVASAYENEIPQLIITAQTPLTTLGKGAFQESSCTGVNILGMFTHCTRYNSFVSHPLQLQHKLIAATMAAYRRPCGPVHLSIPLDVLNAPIEQQNLRIYSDNAVRSHDLIDYDRLPRLVDEIVESQKVVIVTGMGCSGSVHAVAELANLLNAKIVTSTDGKGLVSPYHPNYRGVFGFAGHSSARATLEDPYVDLVIAIGTNFSEWSSDGWDEKALLNRRLVHIDTVDKHFEYSPMAKLHVVGSIEGICEWLIRELHKNDAAKIKFEKIAGEGSNSGKSNVLHSFKKPKMPNCEMKEPEKYLSDKAPIKPQRLMKELGDLFPPSTRFLADTGNATAWATHYLHPNDRRLNNRRSANRKYFLRPGRRLPSNSLATASVYRACVDFASMGWAIGAAIGTALANPKCPVVCITGDGSILMNGQEMTVALQQQLTVIYVILNDASLGMVKHGQKLAKAKSIGTELPVVDFKKFAESMGIDAYRIRSPKDFVNIDIDHICSKKSPTLLDVGVDVDEVPPIETRIKILDKANQVLDRF